MSTPHERITAHSTTHTYATKHRHTQAAGTPYPDAGRKHHQQPQPNRAVRKDGHHRIRALMVAKSRGGKQQAEHLDTGTAG